MGAASGLAATTSGAFAVGNLDDSKVAIELPRLRVPLSFIIDDSTCLVNMGKYCMPQFANTYPDRDEYKRPWRDWPHEIPDSFVRNFGEWCAEHGVKGKYSIVPYPACVGWLDRELPGWSHRELQESLKLVRELMLPSWDIHPEMITHTRAIDLATGRPFADYSPAHMENTYPARDVSVDYLASYLAYSLRILKNCELPCEGITTPGGFGNEVKQKLPVAVFEAVRDVYGAEIPHYFKYVEFDDNVAPKLEARRQTVESTPEFCVNVPAGTDDWFGGWDGFDEPQPDRFANVEANSGRMVELIKKRLPAIMLCHWPGMYCNGQLTGYHAFQRVVQSLNNAFKDETQWMKLSEIARYYAAMDATEVVEAGTQVTLQAPYACPQFTIRIKGKHAGKVQLTSAVDGSTTGPSTTALSKVSTVPSLNSGSFAFDGADTIVCIDLVRGGSKLEFA